MVSPGGGPRSSAFLFPVDADRTFAASFRSEFSCALAELSTATASVAYLPVASWSTGSALPSWSMIAICSWSMHLSFELPATVTPFAMLYRNAASVNGGSKS
eukprot:6231284-Amphidinium_carterae.1